MSDFFRYRCFFFASISLLCAVLCASIPCSAQTESEADTGTESPSDAIPAADEESGLTTNKELRTTSEIIDSFHAQPRKVHPVDFEARISLLVSGWRVFRIQEGGLSIQGRVQPEQMEQLGMCHLGDLVRVQGVTSARENALIVHSIQVLELGDPSQLVSEPAIQDGKPRFWKYVHFEGKVVEVLKRPEEIRVRLEEHGERIWWSYHSAQQPFGPGSLLNQRLRVTGTMQSYIRARTESSEPRPQIVSSEPGQVQFLDAVDHDDEDATGVPEDHLIHLHGFISHIGEDYLIACGHRIDFTMSLSLRQNLPVFIRAEKTDPDAKRAIGREIIVTLGETRQPTPRVSAERLRKELPRYEVVRTHGVIQQHRRNKTRDELTLKSNNTLFRVVLPEKEKGQIDPQWIKGQYAIVTGALEPLAKDGTDERFVLYVSTIDDFILEEPTYQIYKKQLIWITSVVGFLFLVGAVWHVALRRKVSEKTQELSQLNARIVAAAAAVRNGILIVDGAGKVIQSNHIFQDTFGEVSRDDTEDTVFQRCLKDRFQDTRAFAQFWSASGTTTAQTSEEFALKEKDVWTSVTTAMVPDLQGHPAGRIWTFEDVSERKRFEQEFFQSQKLQAVGRLAGGIAHDFNNLLHVIRLNVEAIQLTNQKQGRDPQPEIELVSRAVDRGVSLTRQLSTFSKGSPIETKTTNINRVVEQVASLLTSGIGAHVKISLDLDEDVWLVDIDADQIQQVLMNLCINARDAIGANQGEVLISTSTARHDELGDCVVVSVKDDGCGIPEDAVPQIYEPFFSTKSVDEGNGLGLSVALGIIQQHDGRMNCESAEGSGARFDFYLHRSAAEAIPERPVKSPSPTKEHANLDILLIDDEAMIRTAGKMLLTKMGHQVTTAEDGLDGLETLEEHGAFDLIILDMTMPRLSGRETFYRIRERYPEQKVIVCSGYSEDSQELRTSDGDQPDAFLAKPYSSAAMLEALAEVTGSAECSL